MQSIITFSSTVCRLGHQTPNLDISIRKFCTRDNYRRDPDTKQVRSSGHGFLSWSQMVSYKDHDPNMGIQVRFTESCGFYVMQSEFRT